MLPRPVVRLPSRHSHAHARHHAHRWGSHRRHAHRHHAGWRHHAHRSHHHAHWWAHRPHRRHAQHRRRHVPSFPVGVPATITTPAITTFEVPTHLLTEGVECSKVRASRGRCRCSGLRSRRNRRREVVRESASAAAVAFPAHVILAKLPSAPATTSLSAAAAALASAAAAAAARTSSPTLPRRGRLPSPAAATGAACRRLPTLLTLPYGLSAGIAVVRPDYLPGVAVTYVQVVMATCEASAT
mmetsp:Transcript_76760/g.213315  ORF Transcript_76760/g.213315 Transcript_76760/m.213315 type:complete len:242 (+) Transcript_76760:179-904(+)